MDPVTLAVVIGGGALISAGVQSYFGNKQTKNEQERIAEAGKIAEDLFNQIELPSGEAKPITFEQYAVLKQYYPEIAQFVEEEQPQLIGEAESQEIKQLQNKAIQEYKTLSETGTDAQTEAQRGRLLNDVRGQQNTSRETLLREYSQRGMAGGGQGILAQMSQDAATQEGAQQQALDIASQNQSRRLDALGKMADLSGSVRQQNLNVEQGNKNAINRYNERNAMNRNQYLKYVADEKNKGELFNINQAQQNADKNVGVRNRQTEFNVSREELARQRLLEAKNEKLRSIAAARSGINTMKGQAGAAQAVRDNAVFQTLIEGGTNAATSYAKGAAAPATPGAPKPDFSTNQQTATLTPEQEDTWTRKFRG